MLIVCVCVTRIHVHVQLALHVVIGKQKNSHNIIYIVRTKQGSR